MPSPDKRIKIWAANGSVSCAHMAGRSIARLPVVMFGQQWTAHFTGFADDGRWFELTALPTVDPERIMCPDCGGFNLDVPDGFRWECNDCPWREPVDA